jgi:pentose-5-phosphate-3-epimerase
MSTPKSETAEAKSPDTPADRLQELAEQSTAMARLVARNESAMPELLEQLSHHSDATVRKWVCAHANTPPEVLGRLGGQFPQQLLDNPALDFMILENPNLLRELPQAAKTSMLKRQTCPASFIELMAQDMKNQEGMQLAIAMNPNTPGHIIKELKNSYNPKVADAARQHIHAGRSKKDEAALRRAVNNDLAEIYKIKEWMPWAVVAGLEQPGTAERNVLREMLLQKGMMDVDVVNPHTSTERVLQLLPSASFKARLLLASQANTSKIVLKQLVLDKQSLIREAVASNINTPIELLQQLAQDESANVRIAVSKNPNVQPEILQQLANDKTRGWFSEYPVRQAVARNRSTPVPTLQQMALGKINAVNKILAKNPNTPAEELQRLSQSGDKHVRAVVANNPHTPAEALEQLSHDKARFSDWLSSSTSTPDIRIAVAINPSAPIETLKRLAEDKTKDWEGIYTVRQAVVSNRIFPKKSKMADSMVIKVATSSHTPADVLRQLSKYNNNGVRMAVAENHNTPTNLLMQLAMNKDDSIRSGVLFHNPNYPARNPSTSLELLQRLSQDKNAIIRHDVAQNPSMPAEILRQLAQDTTITWWRSCPVNLSVAENPSTPADVLTQLAQDKMNMCAVLQPEI